MGHGPAGVGSMGPGMHGMHGMGPMGMPGQRFAELVEKEKAGTLTDQEKAQLEQLRKVHAMHMARREARQARFAELGEKEKAGTLSDEEKTELAKIKEIQGRFDALKQKYADRMKDRAARRKASKRLALLAFPGADKNPPARAEFIKHARRVAMLDRARELAEAGEREDLVARIDKLLEKEKTRHDAWVERHKAEKAAKAANTSDADKAEKADKGATP